MQPHEFTPTVLHADRCSACGESPEIHLSTGSIENAAQATPNEMANLLADDLDFAGFQNIVVGGPAVDFYYHGRQYQAHPKMENENIAAAPDLYEAAQKALLVLLQTAKPDDYINGAIDDLNAALAKAEGK